MNASMAMFLVFAGFCLAGAYGVAFARSPLVGAAWLLLALFGVAGLFAQAGAHFLAAMQVLVYAGAVTVLFVFVIMLLNLKEEELGEARWTFWKGAGLVAVVAVFGIIVWRALGPAYPGAPLIDNATRLGGAGFGGVKAVGRILYISSVLPFEVTSLLLLVAVVAAVVVAKGKI